MVVDLHRTHWATMSDLLNVSEDDGLDLVPIVVNADYQNRRIRDPIRKLMAKTPFMMYGVDPDRAASARRYVLLYNTHSDESASHYQLLVRADRTPRGTQYQAVWRRNELPAHLLAEFVHYAK